MSQEDKEKILRKVYYNEDWFGSINETYKEAKKQLNTITIEDTKTWLEKQKGLQTKASRAALFASFAWCATKFFTDLLYPINLRSLLFNEVKVVTPTIFILPETFFTALNAAKPEEIWTVR